MFLKTKEKKETIENKFAWQQKYKKKKKKKKEKKRKKN